MNPLVLGLGGAGVSTAPWPGSPAEERGKTGKNLLRQLEVPVKCLVNANSLGLTPALFC